MRNLSAIKRIATVFLALALGACAMNAQQASPPQSQPGAPGQVAPATQGDPNLPGTSSPPGLNVQWTQYVAGSPVVLFSSPEVHSNKAASYLGWNDQGSWLVSGDDGRIYVWNLQKNSLTKVYNNYKEIPPDVVASFKDNRYAKSGNDQKPAPKWGPQAQTPDTSRQAAFFGGSGSTPQAAAPGGVTGSGATVKNGVLTFTRSNNTKASYKVVRPKVAQGTPGNGGAWIAMEANGNGILFTLNADNSITGREMPAQIIQALMQTAQR